MGCRDRCMSEDLHSADSQKAEPRNYFCGWFGNGNQFCLSIANHTVCSWDIDGKELKRWVGVETRSLAIPKDGNIIYAVSKARRIIALECGGVLTKLIKESATIDSIGLSKDDKYLLLNLLNSEIHLWSYNGQRLLAKYKGHLHTKLGIRSCFGGVNDCFVASGSEDNKVYIWKRHTGELVQVLDAAARSVSWSPKDHQLLATVGDDGTIRIWGVDN